MTDTLAVKRIGVFGHVGNGNLGDEAIFSVVIQNIKNRYPRAEICCFTINPEDTRERHKVAAFPIRRLDKTSARPAPHKRQQYTADKSDQPPSVPERTKAWLKTIPWVFSLLKRIPGMFSNLRTILKEPGFLLHCRKNLKGVDLLIVAGSQQLIDYVAGGAWGHPYTLFKWALIARLQKTKIVFLSCGAGPVRTLLGRFFIRNALALAEYRSYRDELSKKCIEQLGVAGPDPVFPDLVYSFSVKETIPEGTTSAGAKPIVGINPLPFLEPRYWVGGSARNYEIYTGILADFASWLIQRGYAVLLFPTQLRADPPVIEDIRMLMDKNGVPDMEKNIIDRPVHSFDDLVSVISMTDIVIATRFHGVVLSYILNKPVLGIAYAGKTNDLMEQMGQGSFALDILKLDLKSLQQNFILLESQKTAIKETLDQRIVLHRRALEVQYDQVLGLLR
ncbi:MAG: polysaccharide pyruvyl transferase family protein [Sulfuricaulis sp.]